MQTKKEPQPVAPYPKPDAPYDPSVDPGWLERLPGDLEWRLLDELEKLYLAGSIAGACPRCGHPINLDIQIDSLVSEGVAAADTLTEDTTQRPPLEFTCNCLAIHTKDQTGCGASFSLPWDLAMKLPGHP